MEDKTRSPRYPQVSLREAIERIHAVYLKEDRHKADKEVIAKDLGYNGLNGASLGMLAALKHYGLLETAGDGLRISDDAVAILELSRNDPERAEAIQKAAFTPKLFAELFALYGSKLPSDENLRLTLIRRGFNSKAAASVVRTYRDTISLVQEEADGYNGDSTETIKRQEGNMPTYTPHTRQPDPFAKHYVLPSPPQPTSSVMTGQASEGTVLSFKISQDSEARIAFSGKVTQEAIEKLIKLLDISKDTFPAKSQVEEVLELPASELEPKQLLP